MFNTSFNEAMIEKYPGKAEVESGIVAFDLRQDAGYILTFEELAEYEWLLEREVKLRPVELTVDKLNIQQGSKLG